MMSHDEKWVWVHFTEQDADAYTERQRTEVDDAVGV
jgi:hypothetical protein